MPHYMLSLQGKKPYPIQYSPRHSEPIDGHGYIPKVVEADTPAEAASKVKEWYTNVDYPTHCDTPMSVAPDDMDFIMLTTAGGLVVTLTGDIVEVEDAGPDTFEAHTFNFQTMDITGSLAGFGGMFGI